MVFVINSQANNIDFLSQLAWCQAILMINPLFETLNLYLKLRTLECQIIG